MEETTPADTSPSRRQRDLLGECLRAQQVVILDGGLATELEARGCDLDDELWSARVLLERPELIRQVHVDYLRAGADCLVSASYQASFEGFARRGLSDREAVGLLRRSVELAIDARGSFWNDARNRSGRLFPVVAASIGPYGAYLADGSEFRGNYRLNEEQLRSFHRRRWRTLAASGADLLACETIPARSEARALRRLLEENPEVSAWFSFSCRDGHHISDGSRLAEVIAEIEDCPQITALGINCTPPECISSLIDEARRSTDKPLVVYPNSGEVWDASTHRWLPARSDSPSLEECCQDWQRRGAGLIGGCCRTRPGDIRQVRRRLLG